MAKVTEETGVRFLRQFSDPPNPTVQPRALIMPDQLLPSVIGESEQESNSMESNLDGRQKRDQSDDDDEESIE